MKQVEPQQKFRPVRDPGGGIGRGLEDGWKVVGYGALRTRRTTCRNKIPFIRTPNELHKCYGDTSKSRSLRSHLDAKESNDSIRIDKTE